MPRKLKTPIPTGVSAYAHHITGETVGSYPKRAPGRPVMVKDARRVSVWLDPLTIDFMRDYGDGNVSEGIRRAQQHISLGF